mmetsp:Transcript_12363/g.21421  ORF Transcript_12363/g.21421 Transcript_12363/m.21421 type:complete len:103 (-) Transcript_12363:36-344(-)
MYASFRFLSPFESSETCADSFKADKSYWNEAVFAALFFTLARPSHKGFQLFLMYALSFLSLLESTGDSPKQTNIDGKKQFWSFFHSGFSKNYCVQVVPVTPS